MNLAGIPPLSGFIGKVGLLQAGVADGSPLAWVLVAAGVVTSLLTLFAVAKIWGRAFWRALEPARVGGEAASGDAEGTPMPRVMPRVMTSATAAMTAVGLAVTVFAGPLYGLSDRAAGDLLDRATYQRAVFPGSPGGSP